MTQIVYLDVVPKYRLLFLSLLYKNTVPVGEEIGSFQLPDVSNIAIQYSLWVLVMLLTALAVYVELAISVVLAHL